MTIPGAVEAPEEIIELRPRTPLQHTLARWLATLKPEWYPSAATAYANFEHDFAQAGTTCKIWVILQNARPQAWLMVRRRPGERNQVEIVRLGGEVGGRYQVDAPGCGALVARAAAWAAEQGADLLIHWTSSEGLAIHGRALLDLPTALQGIGGADSPIWAFWVEQEFMLWGLLPDLYGRGQHGVLVARQVGR